MPKPSDTIQEVLPSSPQVKRGPLTAMGTCYALGTFNDNFFKQAGLLLAASAHLAGIQGLATLLFALPFVVCSAWTGWLADRLPKKNIVIWCKVVELTAMCLGLWSLYVMSWPGLVLVVFLMGMQAAFFSPAINGAIPEYFPIGSVPKVNAILKVATTASILLGFALAGFFLDIPFPALAAGLTPSGEYGAGRLTIGLVAVLVSALGLFAALSCADEQQSAMKRLPFPGWARCIRSGMGWRRGVKTANCTCALWERHFSIFFPPSSSCASPTWARFSWA